jgi:putative protease
VGKQQWVGEFLPQKPQDDSWLVEVKNRFTLGDQLTLLTPEGSQTFVVDDIRDSQGQPLALAPGSGHSVRITLPHSIDPTTALLVKDILVKEIVVKDVAVKDIMSNAEAAAPVAIEPTLT